MKMLVLLLVLSLLFLASCGTSKNTQQTPDEPSTTITAPSDDNQIMLVILLSIQKKDKITCRN